MATFAQPSYIKPAPSKAGIKHLALMREACQLTEAIDEATQADPDFCKEIASHLLNPDLFMQSAAAADAARASFDTGYAKGSVEHG